VLTFVVEGKQCEWVVRTRVMSDCGGEHGSGGLVSWCSDDGVDDVYEIDVPSALVNSAASPLHLRVLLYDQDLGADDFIGSKSFELAPPPAGGEVAVNWTPVTHGTLAHIMSKGVPTELKFAYSLTNLGLTPPRGKGLERPKKIHHSHRRSSTNGPRGSATHAGAPAAAAHGSENADDGPVSIRIEELTLAGGVPDLDVDGKSGTSDIYVQFVVIEKEADWVGVTSTKNNVEGAEADDDVVTFEEAVEVCISHDAADASDLRVRCLVWDKDLNKDDDFIGTCELKLHGNHGVVKPHRVHLSERALEEETASGSRKPLTLAFKYSVGPQGHHPAHPTNKRASAVDTNKRASAVGKRASAAPVPKQHHNSDAEHIASLNPSNRRASERGSSAKPARSASTTEIRPAAGAGANGPRPSSAATLPRKSVQG